MTFPKNRGKNIGKSISKNLSNKYSQKPLDHTKRSATDAFKTVPKRAKRVIQKLAEETGDLIGNKIADRTRKFLRTTSQDILETVEKEYDKEIPKERYISPEESSIIMV